MYRHLLFDVCRSPCFLLNCDPTCNLSSARPSTTMISHSIDSINRSCSPNRIHIIERWGQSVEVPVLSLIHEWFWVFRIRSKCCTHLNCAQYVELGVQFHSGSVILILIRPEYKDDNSLGVSISPSAHLFELNEHSYALGFLIMLHFHNHDVWMEVGIQPMCRSPCRPRSSGLG